MLVAILIFSQKQGDLLSWFIATFNFFHSSCHSFDFITAGMIMGASISTVYYNLRLRHPTLDMPLIDYDLALIFQPMLMLGISIGVICNVMFADWMVTVLLIILFIGSNYIMNICLFTLIYFVFKACLIIYLRILRSA